MNVQMRVSSLVSGIPNINNAAMVLGLLTRSQPRSFKLGINEMAVLPQTTEIHAGHIPSAGEKIDPFRDAELGFLAGISKIDGGIKWADQLLRVGGPFDVNLERGFGRINLPEVIGRFRAQEMPGTTPAAWTSNKFISGRIASLDKEVLLALAWFLRDKYRDMPTHDFTYPSDAMLDLMHGGRVGFDMRGLPKDSSAMFHAKNMLAGSNIMGIDTERYGDVRRFGTVYQDMGDYYVRSIKYNQTEDSFIMFLENTDKRYAHCNREYQIKRQDVYRIILTTAEEPKILI